MCLLACHVLHPPPMLHPLPHHLPPRTADELIRQVTINCAERGLLLLRVRDEIRMTIAAYQTLYESRCVRPAVPLSCRRPAPAPPLPCLTVRGLRAGGCAAWCSIAFGMRKALMAEQRKAELEAKVRAGLLRGSAVALGGRPGGLRVLVLPVAGVPRSQ
jgi:hypothetical protein